MAKMAIIQSIIRIITILAALTKLTVCLYEDQIGKFDWKQSYVGKIKFAHFDSVKRIVIATEENVIAAVNLKNGQLFWRNVLEEPSINRIELLHVDKEIISVSGGQNTYYVRGWDLSSGILLWEWVLHPDKTNGRWFVDGRRLIHFVPVVNSHIEVTEYDVQTGKNKEVSSRLSTPWVSDLSKCALTEMYFACISSEDSNGQLYFINLSPEENAQVISKPLSIIIGNAPGKVSIEEFKYTEPAVFLIRNNVARLVILKQSDATLLPNSFSPHTILINNNDQMHFMDLSTNSDNSILKIRTIEPDVQDNTIDVEYMNTYGKPKALTGICRGNACRMLFTTSADVVGLLQLPAGKILWTREESLSKISGVEFVELPVSDLDASIEKEFTPSNDLIAMLYNRLLSQTRQLTSLLSGRQMKSNKLIRDEFGLHKLIIVATKVGKLFALDTLTGEIVWSRIIPNIEPFKVFDKEVIILLEQRNARYAPLTAEYVLIARDSSTGKGVLYNFDPITGEPKDGLKLLDYRIRQVMLLPYEDATHLKSLLILSDMDKPYIYPNSRNDIPKHSLSTTYMFTINSSSGFLTGFNFVHSSERELKATPTWKLTFRPSEIVAISIRPAIERVHSQGRVLADRSVLYKYVNPNLIALATLTEDPLHKHVLSVYLIDGVTGLVVYSINHKRAKGPVHLVHSENWVVYSYFNERFRRMEMGALELYEGAMQSNSTAFSSHALSQLPHVESLSCILSAYPLAMVATLTERGITNKHLLIALTHGGVNEMPWMFLEPRGQHILSGPDEGSVPYMPELPLVTEATINYNQSLARVTGISVSPARLESTTLVFVHGLDLFYTRVTPSKTFDMLKEDFDHWLIVMVLVGLIFSSYITKQLALRKALRQAWK